MHLDALQTKCRCIGGIAFGTQTGGAYDDSSAYLVGFGNDHEVSGTVWLRSGVANKPNREVEILLHWSEDGPRRATSYGPTHANGYEINWSHIGHYLILGRFKGAELTRARSTPAPRTGDTFRARIEGQRIRVWINSALQIDYTDNKPGLQITTGNPGIGFYIDAGASNTDFGFNSVTVSAL